MIITCPKDNKKFEIDATLIPDKGRTLQCGACNHVWFYKPEIQIKNQQNEFLDIEQSIQNFENPEKKINNLNDIELSEKPTIDIKNIEIKQKDNENNGSFVKILSFIIVSIISFSALIVILDTFKSPLSNLFPGLELLLYNLFESVKDIILFLKNLFK